MTLKKELFIGSSQMKRYSDDTQSSHLSEIPPQGLCRNWHHQDGDESPINLG